jgi:hypothetical protein
MDWKQLETKYGKNKTKVIDLKEFLNPDLRKNYLTTFFIIICFVLLVQGLAEEIPTFLVFILFVPVITYTELGFSSNEYYDVIVLIISIIYLYLLSCIIVLVYDLVRKKEKIIIRKKVILVTITVILIIPLPWVLHQMPHSKCPRDISCQALMIDWCINCKMSNWVEKIGVDECLAECSNKYYNTGLKPDDVCTVKNAVEICKNFIGITTTTTIDISKIDIETSNISSFVYINETIPKNYYFTIYVDNNNPDIIYLETKCRNADDLKSQGIICDIEFGLGNLTIYGNNHRDHSGSFPVSIGVLNYTEAGEYVVFVDVNLWNNIDWNKSHFVDFVGTIKTISVPIKIDE